MTNDLPSVGTEDARSLADEMDAMSERITRYSNGPGDGLLAIGAETVRNLVSERDELASRVRELEGAMKPNLFWNDADPEHGETSIFEVIDREWNGGCMEHGAEMVIQQAVRLPNIRVRLIPCPTDGDDYFDYEVIDTALSATTPESKP